MTAQNVANGSIRNCITQVGQSADHAVIGKRGLNEKWLPIHKSYNTLKICLTKGPLTTKSLVILRR